MMRLILLFGMIAFWGCNGCHNIKAEEAGKSYKDTKRQEDSALQEMEKLRTKTVVDDKEIANTNSFLIAGSPWALTSIRDATNRQIRDVKFGKEFIRFTDDSILIQTEKEKFAGTWKNDQFSLNIKINGTSRFNYSIANRIDNDQMCLTILGNSDTLKCFQSLTVSEKKDD